MNDVPEGKSQDSAAAQATGDLWRRGEAYLEQSRADLKTARRLAKEGRHLDGAYLCFQAAVNALTSVCFFNGVARVPNHSALALLATCTEADPLFAAPEEACAELEAVQGLNPYGTGRDEAEEKRLARACQAHGRAVVKAAELYFKKINKKKRARLQQD